MIEPRFVEATGPDVETAIKNGLAKLGVDSKNVIVEVLEESSRGLFGIGGHPAKVRLTLLAPATPPPARADRPARPSAEGEQPAPRSRRRRHRSKSRTASGEARPQAAPATPSAEAEFGEDMELEEDLPLPPRTAAAPDDEEARTAVETLQEILGKMGINASVEASYAEPADENESGPLVLQVTGKDLGVLIGRRGETLAALQYITRLIVSRELQRRTDLVVDVEHYKARREQRLQSLALRMAKQATQRGRTINLEPMPAYERRIIHLSLRDRTDVYTESVGEGENRKVTIVPVKNR